MCRIKKSRVYKNFGGPGPKKGGGKSENPIEISV